MVTSNISFLFALSGKIITFLNNAVLNPHLSHSTKESHRIEASCFPSQHSFTTNLTLSEDHHSSLFINKGD